MLPSSSSVISASEQSAAEHASTTVYPVTAQPDASLLVKSDLSILSENVNLILSNLPLLFTSPVSLAVKAGAWPSSMVRSRVSSIPLGTALVSLTAFSAISKSVEVKAVFPKALTVTSTFVGSAFITAAVATKSSPVEVKSLPSAVVTVTASEKVI